MNWREHLTASEAELVALYEAQIKEISADRRKLYERAWKRAKRA